MNSIEQSRFYWDSYSLAFSSGEDYNPGVMRSPEMSIGLNKTEYVNKVKITTVAEQKKRTAAGSVAEHEATHAVAAIVNGTSVESVTIVPGPGYLGLTKLSKPDAVAAAASQGHSGTSHDVAIVHAMGEHSAFAVARTIIATNQDKVAAVASVIEERGTITGGEVEEAMRSVDDPKENVTVIVEDLQTGERETKTETAAKGVVVFRSAWLREADVLPSAA